jgi:hypothetical protein
MLELDAYYNNDNIPILWPDRLPQKRFENLTRMYSIIQATAQIQVSPLNFKNSAAPSVCVESTFSEIPTDNFAMLVCKTTRK